MQPIKIKSSKLFVNNDCIQSCVNITLQRTNSIIWVMSWANMGLKLIQLKVKPSWNGICLMMLGNCAHFWGNVIILDTLFKVIQPF